VRVGFGVAAKEYGLVSGDVGGKECGFVSVEATVNECELLMGAARTECGLVVKNR